MQRQICSQCIQPQFACYCHHLRPFDPHLEFAILIHPIEYKRRIASGRMSHLMLKHSHFILGSDFTNHLEVNALLMNTKLSPLLLYPGKNSINLTSLNRNERTSLVEPHRKPLIFVIDGTWNSAKKTMYLSENLKTIRRISFVAPTQSNFRVRKQPALGCYSTLEAIHHTIELLGPSFGFDLQDRKHDQMLEVFNALVDQQLDLIQIAKSQGRNIHLLNKQKRPA